MAAILGIGTATLDIVNEVDSYPPEDSEVRARVQRRRQGGNAANTLRVLAQLGHRCAWAGVWADEPDGRAILAELQARAVATDTALRSETGKSPVSYITLARATGSRTIIHHRDLPELPAAHVEGLDLTSYHWIHLEGRPNTGEIHRMLRLIRRHNPGAGISLEAEKPREGIEHCLHDPEVVFFSRELARSRGFDDPEGFLRSLDPAAVPGIRVCTWGGEGAAGLDNAGRFHSVPARAPDTVVDTTGAGDTFAAGVIDAFLKDAGLDEALAAAADLAGRKCGQMGLDGLVGQSR